MNFKNNKNIIITLLVLTVIVVISGYNIMNRNEPEEMPPLQQEEDQQSQSEDLEEEVEKVEDMVGEEAPYFTLKNERGENISLEKFIGKPVILSFWVSWNEDSKKQLDIIENINRLVEKDATFLGVHTTTFETLSKEELREYLEENQYSFEILLDEEGEVNQEYYVGNFPTIVFLDYEGRVVQTYTALIEEDIILDELEAILWQQQSSN